MINAIIDFSIRNKLIVGLFMAAWIAAGVWSMWQVPIDAVPDITNNQVQIITVAPSLGTEDIEQFVTYPVEVALANLPGVDEIRSVSRFGLSVVTVVFEESMGTYLPRQLVGEKLGQIRESIPEGFGTPEMGPITTGLGEILQYTIDAEPSHADTYSPIELRAIQDWVVRRQMALVPGVVEVNSFGGATKQYEVLVKPHVLNAFDVTLSDVFSAIEANNQNTGGAYIEKDHMAYFIRGEGLVRSLEDIRNITVANRNGVPVRIRDLAEVRTGGAIRYGAFTKNGQGEAVGGIIFMLKGANSNTTIQAVKARVAEIEKSLPEGLTINTFLDRSKLISETTGTVTGNLVEGGLIVIFILVLLLGNWRGGLIVASTIPLSLLFAFILMNAFGVWANLMSLGAIDFGIIVDGAVIIVESTAFYLMSAMKAKGLVRADERAAIAANSSKKMMNSAFFGQLIILIVFLPILALEGVEGAMFRPMALTFMFAMAGAMILCLTYVPMMSAWFLRAPKAESVGWGDRIVAWIETKYAVMLDFTLRRPAGVIVTALILLVASAAMFTRIGGEFIPQLDEGDIAFHVILRPGSSLEEAVKTSTQVEQIVLAKFPEVKQALTRFGVADVPTDPMPMDIGDCFLILKPRSEWVSASSKDELIEKIKEAISVLPGVSYEFSQPIEMRFNELITGVREDIAIKLYGDDLNTLARKAEEIGQIISPIPGIGDMKVEATSGLPQMLIQYERSKMAQYGLRVDDVNQTIQMAFAGGVAGVVFEGEKRFDVVVKLHEEERSGIDGLRNLLVALPNGNQIPLDEIAQIDYGPAPMQISRDNTNRRTYVGVNVRGRDVESLVTEIRAKLDAELDLPPGYYIRYGGAFENLERATRRLAFVVPMALALIFLMIFFALRSLSQTLLIYIAIPFAAIGGVFSLALRGLPFSISAGVGFVVLFGVAVLNGLVLMSSLNDLKAEGVADVDERVRLGTRQRIRAILLTALTDVFGFLPMAISVSAGAEVQRPLATVVIGGLITSTLLTLFVLPVLYRWLENRDEPKVAFRPAHALWLLLALPLVPGTSTAQSAKVVTTMEEALSLALANHPEMKVAELEVQRLQMGRKAAFNPEKLDVDVEYGQSNSFENDLAISLSQRFAFPTVYAKQRRLSETAVLAGESGLEITANRIRRDVRSSWHTLAFLLEKERALSRQDSLNTRFLHAATIRYETQATSLLEKMTAESRVMQLRNELNSLKTDIRNERETLKLLVNDTTGVVFSPTSLRQAEVTARAVQTLESNPTLGLARNRILHAQAEAQVAAARLLPDITVGYFNHSIIGGEMSDGRIATSGDRFSGVTAGLSVPLFWGATKSETRQARVKEKQAITQAEFVEREMLTASEQLQRELDAHAEGLAYFRDNALPLAERMRTNAQSGFENGAIDYVEYTQALSQALEVQLSYLEVLHRHNQTGVQLQFLIGL